MVNSGQRILVVEDDHDIGDILKYILEDKGYEVQLLRYGRQAFEAILSFEPALILMDIMLPDSDGSEICKEVKALHPALPVILLSAGYFMQPTVADDFIVKPFDVNDVLLKVRQALIDL
jgi:two-component system OmpR family response regulator